MKSLLRQIFLILLWLIWNSNSNFAIAIEQEVPRTILAFYDSREAPEIRKTRIHRLAEMPMNHLGLKVRYWDVHSKLPSLEEMKGIRGVMTWFQSDKIPDPQKFIRWADQVMGRGIRWVIFGNPGINLDVKGRPTPLFLINRYLGNLGLRSRENWKEITYDVRLTQSDWKMTGFERPFPKVLPPFPQIESIGKSNRVYLDSHWGKAGKFKSDLIVISSNGGYAAQGYAYFENGDFQQWYLNPFEFFRLAFATDGLPKPDATTISGRRIYYSHIDGDGWRNISEIKKYKKTKTLSAEVVMKEAIKPYPDLPITVAPIAADLDPAWFGTQESQSLAKQMFALPQVEGGSHTYSHPFFWKYFENYDAKMEWDQFVSKSSEEREILAIHYAPYIKASSKPAGNTAIKKATSKNDPIPHMYESPRAYNNFPFDLEKEIAGSIKFINRFMPPGKKVEVLQWSGDTTPFPAALEATQKSNVTNVNGGDPRLDAEFPSHAWVSPIGAQVGDQLQIYASASNENTFTALWEDRYFGFKYLKWTLKNAESPRRLKPFNIYYHMYSGEKTSSLKALLYNLEYARSQELAPVTTSHYAKVGAGFFSTRFTALGPNKWRVENRGALQTIRFDRSTFMAVDWENSRGVIGQRHFQGSLYVSLDAASPSPLIALKSIPTGDRLPEASKAFLIQGRWRIWNLNRSGKNGISFSGQGFGDGNMVWKVPWTGTTRLELSKEKNVIQTLMTTVSEDGILNINFGPLAVNPVKIKISRVDGML